MLVGGHGLQKQDNFIKIYKFHFCYNNYASVRRECKYYNILLFRQKLVLPNVKMQFKLLSFSLYVLFI